MPLERPHPPARQDEIAEAIDMRLAAIPVVIRLRIATEAFNRGYWAGLELGKQLAQGKQAAA